MSTDIDDGPVTMLIEKFGENASEATDVDYEKIIRELVTNQNKLLGTIETLKKQITDRVYVVVEGVEYCGESLIGIFDSEHAAIKYVEDHLDDNGCDYIDITVYPIGWNDHCEDQENGQIVSWTNRKLYKERYQRDNCWRRIDHV